MSLSLNKRRIWGRGGEEGGSTCHLVVPHLLCLTSSVDISKKNFNLVVTGRRDASRFDPRISLPQLSFLEIGEQETRRWQERDKTSSTGRTEYPITLVVLCCDVRGSGRIHSSPTPLKQPEKRNPSSDGINRTQCCVLVTANNFTFFSMVVCVWFQL